MKIRLQNLISRFRRDDEGVTLVEYGIGLVLAVTVGTFLFTSLGNQVLGEMSDACTVLSSSGTALNSTNCTVTAVTTG
jgi:Flp pilus assembly pilin Flp